MLVLNLLPVIVMLSLLIIKLFNQNKAKSQSTHLDWLTYHTIFKD